jgi:hypothetical protein
LFCLGFFALTFCGSWRVLTKLRIVRNIGSSRAGTDEEAEREAGETAIAIKPMKTTPSSGDMKVSQEVTQHAIEFTPMSIAWQNLEYTVDIATQAGGGTKQLLQSITSAARPNRMLALMVRAFPNHHVPPLRSARLPITKAVYSYTWPERLTLFFHLKRARPGLVKPRCST